MKKYQIIYADPAWNMGRVSKKRVLVPSYQTMQDFEISAMPICDIADRDCALFLWAINSKIPQAMGLMAKWEFRFVGVAFCWIKTSRKTGKPNCRMSGNYTLQGMEQCMLMMRGRLPVQDRTVRQIVESPRENHSKKPNEVRNRIVRLFGDIPRIELFAREKHDGWDAWGDEIPENQRARIF